MLHASKLSHWEGTDFEVRLQTRTRTIVPIVYVSLPNIKSYMLSKHD